MSLVIGRLTIQTIERVDLPVIYTMSSVYSLYWIATKLVVPIATFQWLSGDIK